MSRARMSRVVFIASVVLSSIALAQGAAKGVELDLTDNPSPAVAVTAPIVPVSQSGAAFSGLDTTKTTYRLNQKAHERVLVALRQKFDGRLLPADVVAAAIRKAELTPAALRTAAGRKALARATGAQWVVVPEVNWTGTLVAVIAGSDGEPVGEQPLVTNAEKLTTKNAEDLAVRLGAELSALTKPPAEPVVTAPPLPEDDGPPLPSVEEEAMGKPPPPVVRWSPQRSRMLGVLAVGAGGVSRQLQVSGETASALAELQGAMVAGVSVHARLMPLEWFDRTAGSPLGDVELEVHYRRAFVRASGVSGSITGTSCAVTDDDVQFRGTWRYRFGGMAPSVGVSAAWSQERTMFACNLPVVSTTWRGVDAQLRLRQPLFRDLLALELAAGPRFLVHDGTASSLGLSWAGEAWIEALPWSFVFARAGARVSRLSATQGDALSAVDTRLFFAIEIGAFL